ncbi:30-kDa cleavage and polyadenylation specificity factor 30 [Lachnellula hyalina]|uniref:30-kDa cleavage and polyadenylation specificity factor 30 n=1 Tax=Lachnellula hyalina TaxID=1316788 RepID=A0A8H8R3X8_9HELO|nr:30-kDa cleavage and polyadenylation specificity factor 30 [Lachnellula hyalina]TVY27601.1 30-kDa cleavage and polyadenylation specificity factor 30 [Lachnellula hyalina]
MWQNNGFGTGPDSPFRLSFNQNDMLFGGDAGTPIAGQQGFPQFQRNLMDADAYQPEVGLYNQDVFTQHQHMSPQHQYSPTAPHQYNTLPQNNPTPTRPPAMLKARAAELKAQLLKGKEARAGSATPPVPTAAAVARQNASADASSSLHGSPKTPSTATETHDQDVNDLIAQYSVSKPTASAQTKDQNSEPTTMTTNTAQGSIIPSSSAKSQESSLESPIKVPNPPPNGISAVHAMVKANQSRHASNGSISEGEILEDTPKKPSPPTEPRQRQPTSKPATIGDELTRTMDNQLSKNSNGSGARDDSPPRRAPPLNPRSYSQRGYDERRDESQPRPDRRGNYQPDHKPERKSASEFEKDPYQRRSSRDENYHRPDSNNVQKREETKAAYPQKLSTLDDVLTHDEDLKEWLEITGYHNAPYRDKILSRRRALARLDAERKRLLADIEADERSGLPPTPGPQTSVSSMLPPPIPNKVGPQNETTTLPTEKMDESKSDRLNPIKRAHSDVDDGRDGGFSGKIARIGDRGPRIKDEDDYDHHRPRSSGSSAQRWQSTDHRDERSPPIIGMMTIATHEIEVTVEIGTFHLAAGHLRAGRQLDLQVLEQTTRVIEIEMSTKSETSDHFRELQSHQQHDSKSESSFGSRIANGKPYKEQRGFDRGGKGDTRYFIVKSYNEENVLRCIADSVWTTQAQNGSVFKEAFESCKNVILVFSINKSKAFQGYARMESLPGSVQRPAWQESINWESAGAFKVKWMVVCSTKFHRIGHLKNALNEDQAVLIGKDGQEIEENCGLGLIELIHEEAREALIAWRHSDEKGPWEDYR